MKIKTYNKDTHKCTASKIRTGRTGPYFIKVKIILSLRFKINLIFYLIKEFMKNSCFNFFYEIVNEISIKVQKNSKFKESAKT